jgi:hypothetical protein
VGKEVHLLLFSLLEATFFIELKGLKFRSNWTNSAAESGVGLPRYNADVQRFAQYNVDISSVSCCGSTIKIFDVCKIDFFPIIIIIIKIAIISEENLLLNTKVEFFRFQKKT